MALKFSVKMPQLISLLPITTVVRCIEKKERINSLEKSPIPGIKRCLNDRRNIWHIELEDSLYPILSFSKRLISREEKMNFFKASYFISRPVVSILLWFTPIAYKDEAIATFWEGEDHSIANALQYFYGGIEYRFSILRRIILPKVASNLKRIFQRHSEISNPIPEDSYFISQNH